MYTDLYSSLLDSRHLKSYFGVVLISLFGRKSANQSVKELHVSLVVFMLKRGGFELKVYKSEIGAWVASAAPLYGVNSHKKKHIT